MTSLETLWYGIKLNFHYFSGPLTSYDAKDNKYYIQGVASFGAPNCDYPNVYARVSAAECWIKCVIKEEKSCHAAEC